MTMGCLCIKSGPATGILDPRITPDLQILGLEKFPFGRESAGVKSGKSPQFFAF
jgi:hypothetical protein